MRRNTRYRERGKEMEKNGETLKRERLVLVVGAGGIVGSRRPGGVKNETELAASESERLPLLPEKESGTDINFDPKKKKKKKKLKVDCCRLPSQQKYWTQSATETLHRHRSDRKPLGRLDVGHMF
jgi:hypothetical protein